jgi:hypothetical protein
MGLQPQHREYYADIATYFIGFFKSYSPIARTFKRIYFRKDVFPCCELFLHGHRISIFASAKGKNLRSNI